PSTENAAHITVWTQNTVRGKITDQEGNPVAGASVSNLVSGAGTSSNDQGEFEISGQSGEELRITMVGYVTQTVSITGTQIQITLDVSQQAVEEVVVVPYRRQKPVKLQGAVAQVGREVLEVRPGDNEAQALQGAVPNL